MSPPFILIFILSFLTFVESDRGEDSKNLCTGVRHVSLLLKFISNQILPRNHVNIVHDIDIGLHQAPCLNHLFHPLPMLNGNHDEGGKSTPVTVSIGNGLWEDSKKNGSRFQEIFHRFLSWGWLNSLLIDGGVEENSFQDLTRNIRTRATVSFFTDFTLLWQRQDYNPEILHSRLLEKLKFKVEVQLEGEDLWMTSVCFYCNNGLPIRKMVTRTSPLLFRKGLRSQEETFPDFTTSFHGRVLQVTGGIGIPLLMNFREVDGVWSPSSGFMIQPILFHLQHKMNFSMSTRVFRTFGSQLENGSFTGFVNELFHERSDLGFAGQSYDRIQAVHFLDPIHIDAVSFSTALPDSGVKWHAVFRAFNWDTWLLCFALCLLIILPLYVWLGKFPHWINPPTPTCPTRVESNRYNFWKNGIGFLFRPIMDQDLTPSIVPREDSGRVLMVYWLCTVLILSTIYKSKLTSLMVHPETEQVPNSFESLGNSKYEIILHHVGGALHKNIQSTTSKTFQRIRRKLVLENSMFKCLQAAATVKKTACISYIHNLIGETHRNFTNWNGVASLRMAQTQNSVFMTAGSYMLPKSAVYKESMNFVVATQIAFGFSKYALDQAFQSPLDEGKAWARQRPEIHGASQMEQGHEPLGMTHMMAAFLLHFLGSTFSSIILSWEKCSEYKDCARFNKIHQRSEGMEIQMERGSVGTLVY